jgi:FkbH-like protein
MPTIDSLKLREYAYGDAYSPTLANSIAREARALSGRWSGPRIRIALLGTTTLDFFAGPLVARALSDGILAEVSVGPFNQITQQVVDRDSALYRSAPDAIFLLPRVEELGPRLLETRADVGPEQVAGDVEEVLRTIEGWVEAIRRQSGAQIVLHTFVRPAWVPLGVRDVVTSTGQRSVFGRLNDGLAAIASRHVGTTIVDLDDIVRRVGMRVWRDPKLWYFAGVAGGTRDPRPLLATWMTVVRDLAGRRKKCLVVDLDNTLWGGIVGEDEIGGIKIGDDFPGNIFAEVQRQMLDLWHQGVILAINSKNNLDDAKAVFERHANMVLRWDHFQVRKINWDDKAANLRAIARELNLGVDSLVFVDDNPVECDRVQSELPEVTVLRVPTDLAEYPRLLVDHNLFDGITFSDEDRSRNRMYQESARRDEALSTSESIDEFLTGLDMIAEIEPIGPENLVRSVQLLQKTNQFNLTTRRHSESAVKAFAADSAWLTYAIRLKDKFGDNGQVGVALVRVDGARAELDTLLLSCRVIGRTLEHAIVRRIVSDLRERGVVELIGVHIPTKKNVIVESLFGDFGFTPAGARGNERHFTLTLLPERQLPPTFVRSSAPRSMSQVTS